jgi:hypothetical protein
MGCSLRLMLERTNQLKPRTSVLDDNFDEEALMAEVRKPTVKTCLAFIMLAPFFETSNFGDKIHENPSY